MVLGGVAGSYERGTLSVLLRGGALSSYDSKTLERFLDHASRIVRAAKVPPGLCLGTCESPMGETVSYERGTSVWPARTIAQITRGLFGKY